MSYTDLVKVARKVIRTLDRLKLPSKPVIVFDIDNILLDSAKTIIYPIFNIYNYARMLNITIAIITSRFGTQSVVKDTIKELKSNGIDTDGFLYFRNPSKIDYLKFKNSARANIVKRGYNIIMTLGCNDLDITGNNTGYGVKIPICEDTDDFYLV